MDPYIFQGVVLPERAALSMQFVSVISHSTSGRSARASVSIILNQITMWLETDSEWELLDLRNVVKSLLQNELAKVGYLLGYAYDVEVTRALHRSLGIDQVFGIPRSQGSCRLG